MATKVDISRYVSKHSGNKVGVVSTVLDGLLDAIKDELLRGSSITFQGFGTFTLIERKAKVGQNMKKGGSVIIPTYTTVKFKPLGEFSDKLKTTKVRK